MSEKPQLEKAAQEVNSSSLSNKEEVKAKEFTPTEMLALVDYLEKQGFHEQAAEIRANTKAVLQQQQEEPEVYLGQQSEQRIAVENKARPEEIANQPKTPRPLHNPRMNAIRAGTKTQAEIDNLIKQLSSSKAPKNPTSRAK